MTGGIISDLHILLEEQRDDREVCGRESAMFACFLGLLEPPNIGSLYKTIRFSSDEGFQYRSKESIGPSWWIRQGRIFGVQPVVEDSFSGDEDGLRGD